MEIYNNTIRYRSSLRTLDEGSTMYLEENVSISSEKSTPVIYHRSGITYRSMDRTIDRSSG